MGGRISYLGGIVKDGLILDIDAAKIQSYPRTGTLWNDISGNQNNGTLINGPTFNSENGGSIVFDGTNDYINAGNSLSTQLNTGTICIWVKTSTPGSSFRGIITKQNNYGLFTNNSILVTYDWGNASIRSTGINIADGTWKNICMSFTNNVGTPSNNAIIYINGISILTTTIKYFNNNNNLEISRGGSGSPEQALNGSVSNALIYNRVLSASEVLQNYNATRGRFGL